LSYCFHCGGNKKKETSAIEILEASAPGREQSLRWTPGPATAEKKQSKVDAGGRF